MALWWPGPWGPMNARDPKSLEDQPESPHQAAFMGETPAPKARRRRTAKTED